MKNLVKTLIISAFFIVWFANVEVNATAVPGTCSLADTQSNHSAELKAHIMPMQAAGIYRLAAQHTNGDKIKVEIINQRGEAVFAHYYYNGQLVELLDLRQLPKGNTYKVVLSSNDVCVEENIML